MPWKGFSFGGGLLSSRWNFRKAASVCKSLSCNTFVSVAFPPEVQLFILNTATLFFFLVLFFFFFSFFFSNIFFSQHFLFCQLCIRLNEFKSFLFSSAVLKCVLLCFVKIGPKTGSKLRILEQEQNQNQVQSDF